MYSSSELNHIDLAPNHAGVLMGLTNGKPFGSSVGAHVNPVIGLQLFPPAISELFFYTKISAI